MCDFPMDWPQSKCNSSSSRAKNGNIPACVNYRACNAQYIPVIVYNVRLPYNTYKTKQKHHNSVFNTCCQNATKLNIQ